MITTAPLLASLDDDADELPITAINAAGGGFDWLADEPDLYSDADLIDGPISTGRPKSAIITPMTNAARQIVPDDDDPEEIARLQAMIDEARAADSVPHEIVREWLLALARGERPPAPLP
jgi:hypothetical protein